MLHRQTSSTLHSGPTFFLQPRQLNNTCVRPVQFRGDAECNHGNETGTRQQQQQRVDHATDGELMSSDEKRRARDVDVGTHKSEDWAFSPVPIN